MVKDRGTAVDVSRQPFESGKALFFVAATVVLLVPLAFSTAFHRIFIVPRFSLLVVGSAALLPLVLIEFKKDAGALVRPLLLKPLVVVVTAYLVAIAVSTAFGLAPLASLVGSFGSQMGLFSYACFYVCFIALITGIGTNTGRLNQVLWVMSLAGLVTSIYALFQFAGADPFLQTSDYTFNLGASLMVRPTGTIGHADYLGNFLLYTSPISLSLALRSTGSGRRIALAAFGSSVVAIMVSGTRGAWLGIVGGLAVFAVLELSEKPGLVKSAARPRAIIGAAVTVLIAAVLVLAIGAGNASRGVADRARGIFTEGLSGSGRTLIWSDALRMVPRYALVGSGPEGFREAALAYKSRALARLSPHTNNESSHNSYLDAAISYGLPGAVLYVAIFALMLATVIRARKRLSGSPSRLIFTAIVASTSAVAIHNFFIFDQIPTGLYFFVLAAICQASSNVVQVQSAQAPPGKTGPEREKQQRKRERTRESKKAVVPALICSVFVVPALWYSIALLKADAAVKQAFAAAGRGDYQGLLSAGEAAARAPDPSGAYHFMFARALAAFSDRLASSDTGQSTQGKAGPASSSPERSAAIKLAIDESKVALPHSMEPDSVYLLLAYLSSAADDADAEMTYARRALELDPEYANSHWMMGEAYLAKGDSKSALTEAKAALDLDPFSSSARSLFERAGGSNPSEHATEEEIITKINKRLSEGNLSDARRLALRAVQWYGTSAEPHRLLATVYERSGDNEKAITEWQAYLDLSPGQGANDEARKRIEDLKKAVGKGK